MSHELVFSYSFAKPLASRILAVADTVWVGHASYRTRCICPFYLPFFFKGVGIQLKALQN